MGDTRADGIKNPQGTVTACDHATVGRAGDQALGSAEHGISLLRAEWPEGWSGAIDCFSVSWVWEFWFWKIGVDGNPFPSATSLIVTSGAGGGELHFAYLKFTFAHQRYVWIRLIGRVFRQRLWRNGVCMKVTFFRPEPGGASVGRHAGIGPEATAPDMSPHIARQFIDLLATIPLYREIVEKLDLTFETCASTRGGIAKKTTPVRGRTR
jgi:hypothetical protein